LRSKSVRDLFSWTSRFSIHRVFLVEPEGVPHPKSDVVAVLWWDGKAKLPLRSHAAAILERAGFFSGRMFEQFQRG
jgi:hypothetical protein